MFSEKVNAQTIELTCDVKTHIKRWGNDSWQVLNNRTWTLEIDYKNNLLVLRSNIFYKGENHTLSTNYTIFTNNRNKIVAFEHEDLTSDQGGLSASSITLDLNKGKLTAANHMNDERGYSFSLYYGKCFTRY